MVFADGENFAIRYGSQLGEETPLPFVTFERGVCVWSTFLNTPNHLHCKIMRRSYYTSVQGSGEDRQRVRDLLKEAGVEAPHVFRKDKQRGSKRVDISLAVDMLTHAHRKNMDVAVLVAGDEDYVPLVDAVKLEGCRVVLWFLEDGLSPKLKLSADHYFDPYGMLFEPEAHNIFS